MIGSLLKGVGGALFKTLSGPLVERLAGLAETWVKAGVDKDRIRADIEIALAQVCADVAEHQADVLKTALTDGSWLERNWRAIFMTACGFTLIFYGLITPVTVAYLGWPAPRVGDALLEWIFILCGGGVAGYAGGPPAMRFAERIVSSWRRT